MFFSELSHLFQLLDHTNFSLSCILKLFYDHSLLVHLFRTRNTYTIVAVFYTELSHWHVTRTWHLLEGLLNFLPYDSKWAWIRIQLTVTVLPVVALAISSLNRIYFPFNILHNDLDLSHAFLKFRVALRKNSSSVWMRLKLFLTVSIKKRRSFTILGRRFIAADRIVWEIWRNIHWARCFEYPMLILETLYRLACFFPDIYKLWVFSQHWAICYINSTKRWPSVPIFVGMFFLKICIFNLNCILYVLFIFIECWWVVILNLFISVTVRLTKRHIAVSPRLFGLDDMVYLISHLLVLLQKVWVHAFLLLWPTVHIHLLVCLSIFFLKQSNWWI